jgi:hypothetical protein
VVTTSVGITSCYSGTYVSVDKRLRLYHTKSDNYGNEIWILNQMESQKLEVAQMYF